MKKKSRANFEYRIGELHQKRFLLIWDKDLGNRSVTTDIENVVSDIATHEGIEPTEYLIIYRDSDAYWSGWDAKTDSFFPVSRFLLDQLKFFFPHDLPPSIKPQL
jgi:hypothetical protein